VQDRLPWPPRDHHVSRALLGQRLSIEDFVDLDDVSILHCFKVWTKSDDQPLAALCNGLLNRRLFKTVDLSHLCESDALAVNVKAQDAIRHAGGDPAYDLFYDEPSDSAYQTFVPEECSENAEILIRNPAGRLTPFASLSPLPQALNRQLMFRRLHVAEQWKDTVARCL